MEGLSSWNDYIDNRSVSACSDHNIVVADSEIGCGTLQQTLNAASTEVDDCSHAVLKFINQVLMEDDDFDDQDSTILDSTLQVTEKCWYNILCNKQTLSPKPNLSPHLHHQNNSSFQNPSANHKAFSFPSISMESLMNSPVESSQFRRGVDEGKKLLSISNSRVSGLHNMKRVERDEIEFPNRIRRSPHEEQRDLELQQERRKKQVAVYPEESVLTEMLQNMLNGNEKDGCYSNCRQNGAANTSNNGEAKTKKKVIKRKAIDTRSLLLQCMQAISTSDQIKVDDLLNKIKERSSPLGDASQRLAHCFVKALEARFAGTGTEIYKELLAKHWSNFDALKAYSLYVSEFPFVKTSNYFATQTILEVAEKAKTLHVVHFGIMHGLQIPPIVQALATRPGGPPKLRVTGIDFLRPGPRPSATVEETGRRLAKYCEGCKVPFEFVGVAKNWEDITPEDLKIEKDEVIVVNCLFQLHFLLDDTIMENSPRDSVLTMIRTIKPDLFIHGVTNASYGSPFFATRFREALFYFSALFDMFEAIVPRESGERLLYETEMMGREILNCISCEGTERAERPETYKQWTVRTVRAGFRQVPLSQKILSKVKALVERSFHKQFLVDESSQWMLQGWKGRSIFALSCWKPA
ncbi:hypothetical protein NMG60_11034068 [Bertholletia excelsa]